MNDFTKDELQHIATLFKFVEFSYPDYKLNEDLWVRIESMIDNYPSFNVKKIAESHLNEASSLISHAMCLLGMKDDNQ